jgi:hypothetical protein
MISPGAVRIFIGSGEASVLERKTLVHSLRRTSARELDIRVFNGTHDALEIPGSEPMPVGMPLKIKYRNFTEFSLYRFLIPVLCGHAGRAIWLDSDMLSLADIGELFDLDLGGCAVACVPAYAAGSWASSVMLLDCALANFDLERILGMIDRGLFTMQQFLRFEEPFLRHHPLRIAALDGAWNSFDARDARTRIVHFTNLRTQPWRVPGHPLAPLWLENFSAARRAGGISDAEVRRAVSLGHASEAALVGPVAAPAAPPGPVSWPGRWLGRLRGVGGRHG